MSPPTTTTQYILLSPYLQEPNRYIRGAGIMHAPTWWSVRRPLRALARLSSIGKHSSLEECSNRSPSAKEKCTNCRRHVHIRWAAICVNSRYSRRRFRYPVFFMSSVENNFVHMIAMYRGVTGILVVCSYWKPVIHVFAPYLFADGQAHVECFLGGSFYSE